MLGFILNSLKYRTKLELKDWKKNNDHFQENRYSYIEKEYISYSERPFKSVFSIFFLYALTVINFILWDIGQFNLIDFSYDEVADVSLHNTLWAVQASLVGILYPIVIGLVSLLLKNKTAYSIWLKVYLVTSGAVFSGLSSLALIGVIAINSITLNFISSSYHMYSMFVLYIWFLFNIIFTAYFLYKTISFLKPDIRFLITLQYTLNRVYPDEIKYLLMRHLFVGAINYKFLPGPQYSSDTESKVYISTIQSSTATSDEKVLRNIKRVSYITNVYFRVLSIAIRLWKTKAENKLQSKEIDLFARNLLVLQGMPLEPCNGQVLVASSNIKGTIDPLVSLLIKLSFVFDSFNTKEQINTNDIVTAEYKEVVDSMNSNDRVEFDAAIDRVKLIHTDLLKVGAFTNDSGDKDNWANMGDSLFFSVKLNYQWNRVYYDISNEAVEKINKTRHFYKSACYAPLNVLGRVVNIVDSQLISELLNVAYHNWANLDEWWVTSRDYHGMHKSLSQPYQKYYEQAVYDFVGSWESVNYSFADDEIFSKILWSEVDEKVYPYVRHLDLTSKILLTSVKTENDVGASWGADIIQKWYSTNISNDLDIVWHLNNSEYINLNLLDDSIENSLEYAYESDDPVNKNDVIKLAIRNYWKDVALVSMYYMGGMLYKKRSTVVVDVMTGLLSGNMFHEGGYIYGSISPVESVDDLILSLIRQYFAGSSYQNRLDSLVSVHESLTKSVMISGRGYSGVGADDLGSTIFGQSILLLLLSRIKWDITNAIIKSYGNNILDDDSSLRGFISLVDKYLDYLIKNTQELNDVTDQFSVYLQGVEFSGLMKNATDGLMAVKEHFTNVRKEALIDAPIDNNRLQEISTYASSRILKDDVNLFPMQYFNSVSFTDEEIQERSLRILNQQKGEFTKPMMGNPVSNEDEWYSKTMAGYVSNVLIIDMIKKYPFEKIQTSNESDFINRFNEICNVMRDNCETLILIIDRHRKPEWIARWERIYRYNEDELPENINMQRKDINDNLYKYHINNIPVYVVPNIGPKTLLLCADAFKELKVIDYGGAQYVHAEAVETDEINTINLLLTFGIEIDIDESFRYEFVHNGT